MRNFWVIFKTKSKRPVRMMLLLENTSVNLPDSILAKLKPWQIEPANHLLLLLRAGQNTADLSDTGTGKTYVAAAVVTALQKPTLVVCPKIGLYAWERAMEHFGDRVSLINYESLATGRSLFGSWEYPLPAGGRKKSLVCQFCLCKIDLENFYRCSAHRNGIHCVATKSEPHRYGKFRFAKEIKLLCFDEVHRCGALDSLNAEMLYAARRQGVLTHCLSATAACSPLQMKSLGFVLDLHGGDERAIRLDWASSAKRNFWTWVGQRGCGKIPPLPGYRWKVGREQQKNIMADINADIIPSRGVRVQKKDIPGFPSVQITSDLYDVTCPEKIDALYKEMAGPLAAIDERAALDLDPEHPLTKQIRARQKLEIFKLPIMVELAEDYLAKGYSVGLFVNFTGTLDELTKRLHIKAHIRGGQTKRERDNSVGMFQADEARIIGVQNAAGGLAWSGQDLRGEFPRVGLVFPGFSAVQLRQIFGRFPRDGGKSESIYRLIWAARSMEVGMHRAVSAKLDNLDALNDRDLMPENLRLQN